MFPTVLVGRFSFANVFVHCFIVKTNRLKHYHHHTGLDSVIYLQFFIVVASMFTIKYDAENQ